MSLYTDLIPKLIPGISDGLLKDILGELRTLAKSLATKALIPSLTRIVTKGVDGLVKVFATQLPHLDAERVTHGTINAFETQVDQFRDTLRTYTLAAFEVEAAKRAKAPLAEVDALRKVRESLRLEVRSELSDMLEVLTGGTPED